MKSLIKVCLLSLFLALLVGCQSKGIVSPAATFSNEGLTFERKDIVLKDIPLPPDFVLVKGSFAHGTETFRYGEFIYKGTLSVDDLFYYYQRQMPTSHWREASSNLSETSGRIKFENEYEFCTVLVRESNVTEMKIIVEQKKS
ncbi:MAG: hypothetical protein HQL32_02940 [Planctomycetes bacterium]|nr:hypothetical protein [Planctomycetota bacterium]